MRVSLEVVACDLLDLGQAVTRERPEGGEEARHAVVREPVHHPTALPAALDKTRPAQHLELGGGVGEVHRAGRGQLLDAALGLGEQFQQLDPLRVAQCPCQPAELGIEGVLSFPRVHKNILIHF